MTIGVALIGCGLVGRKRALALPASARLLAVADRDRARAEALASAVRHRPRVVESVKEAVAEPGVELVIVAVVHSELAGASMRALEAGCHVLVEKPGAHRLEDLLGLKEAAERAGRVVRVGFNHRFHPAPLKARQLVAERDFGRLLSVRGRYGHGGRLGYEREWRSDPSVSGGGELLDQGMHLIDLTRFFVGEVELAFVETRTDFWEIPVEDNAYLALRPKAGGFAWLHASWTEWKNQFSFEIAWQQAKLEISGLGGSYGVERLTLYEMLPEMGPPATACWEWPQPDGSWALELEDLVSCLEGEERGFAAGIEDCIAAFRIVDQAYGR